MTGTRSREDLLQAMKAYQESRVLLTALELDLFSAVGTGATASAAAQRCGTDPRATEMLLKALVALGALEKDGAVFCCTAASAVLGTARADYLHAVRKWDTWSSLTECVRTGTTARKPGRRREDDGVEAFIGAMHARALSAAPPLLKAIEPAMVRRMLDLGGGAGTFALAFAQANPHLQAEVLDLKDVVPIAQRHIQESGLAARVSARVGDLRTDDFGSGYDLILASAVCHMLDEAENQDLFHRCAQALVPGGRLAIRDFLLEPEGTAPKEAALFALNMLTSTARGNVYTEVQYRTWLSSAGFSTIARHRDGEDLLIASK